MKPFYFPSRILTLLLLLLAISVAPAALQAQPGPPFDPPSPVTPPTPPEPPQPSGPPVDPPPSPDPSAAPPAKATWDPPIIDAESFDENGCAFVELTLDKDVAKIFLWLTPSLNGFLTVDPEMVEGVQAGVAIPVKLTLAEDVDLETLERNLGGTLHVKETVPPGTEEPPAATGAVALTPDDTLYQVSMAARRTLAEPLPIDIVLQEETEPESLPAAVVNAADFQGGAVAPGQIVSIFGNGLGPPDPSTFQLGPDGRVPPLVADTQVLFDGIPGRVLLAQRNQLNAIVPFSVGENGEIQVQVVFRGKVSEPLTLQVQPAVPALFTLDGSGAGQGAILNQDFSVNSPSNPAARGSVVMLFATGLGVLADGNVDGAIVGSQLVPPAADVSVSIGASPAQVVYIGGSPGLVNAVVQLNVEISELAPAAPAVPIQLTAGGISSTAEVTIAVE